MISEHTKQIIVHDIPTYEGWTTPERGIEMAELIAEVKPEVVVEIGTFGGRSIVCQALALRENGKGKIYGIDPWKKDFVAEGSNDPINDNWWKSLDLDDIHKKAMACIWKHSLDEWAIIIRSPSQFVHQLFPRIDVLYIDGCHSELASCRDVELYVPRVVKGGYVWFDDTDWATTKAAQNLIEKSCEQIRMSPDGHYKLYRKK